MTSPLSDVSYSDVKRAYERISKTVKRTAVFEFDEFNATYGRNFFFKAESMQITGSFKIRGGLNAVSSSNIFQSLNNAAKVGNSRKSIQVPVQGILVLITSTRSEGSGESAHMRRLTRALAAHIQA